MMRADNHIYVVARMAAMVARGGSPLPVKGSRNKRKFRSETPPLDLSAFAPSSGYEFFAAEEKGAGNNSDDVECYAAGCDLCAAAATEEAGFGEANDVDWSNMTEGQLEEILLRNLDMIFKSSVKLIATYGYTEEVAMNALLKSGICCGCKDTVTNTVDNALAFLKSGEEVDPSLGEDFAEELRRLEKSVLTDMVSVLREVRPFFSTGDALWCLLMCDMNVTHACAVESDSSNVVGNDDSSSAPQIESQSNDNVSCSPVIREFNAVGPSKLKSMLPCTLSSPQLGIGVPKLPSGKLCASSSERRPVLKPGTETLLSISQKYAIGSSCSSMSQTCLVDENVCGGRKSNVGSSKRESVLRQKSIHFERSYRAFGSKAIPRGRRVASFGSLALDKKCKSGSGTTCMAVKSASLKIKRLIQTDPPQTNTVANLPLSYSPSASASYSVETTDNPSQLPIANTELSLSLPSTGSNTVSIKPNYVIGATTWRKYLTSQPDKTCGYWVAPNKNDEMLLSLAPRVQELQAQLQEWNEWAQQKVMQAACRLSKEKVELQALRQDKEEMARLKKEKQTLEDNTKKKLSDMELALSKAGGQVGKANAVAHRLEVENAKVRQDMEAAKLEAAKSAVSCQEVSSRETMTSKKVQSWDRLKAQIQEDLMTEKRKLVQLQQQHKQALELRDQLQAKWTLENTMREGAQSQANCIRKEREKSEVSGRATENAINLKAETEGQKYKADVRRLEDQIAQLRLKMESSKLAPPLRWGVDGTYASRISDVRKDSTVHLLSKMMDSLDLGGEDVQRERECVMCLSEEMSVVFLPCAHQVVCTKCNGLHEKQGMKDCPSCRTPIQRRISIFSADS